MALEALGCLCPYPTSAQGEEERSTCRVERRGSSQYSVFFPGGRRWSSVSSVLLPRSVETEEAGTPISWTGLYIRSVVVGWSERQD